MTFFYNLNKTLDAIREKPETTHGQLNERDMSRAAKGHEKYGKEGMEALAKAGREGKDLDKVRDKYNKYDESIDEGMMDAAKSAAQQALNVLGHGDDQDMIRDLQKKAGLPQTGKVPPQQAGQQGQLPAPGQQPMAEDDMEEGNEFSGELARAKSTGAKSFKVDGHEYPVKEAAPMSSKQKSFAALAEPKDKITFADKIAGAKKEVDEMLGDVAAEAMKNALSGGKIQVADEGFPTVAGARDEMRKRKVGDVTHGAKHDTQEIPGGRRVTRRLDPNTGYSVGSDTDAEGNVKSDEKRGRGRPKKTDKAPERVTAKAYKHKGGRKEKVEEGPDEGNDLVKLSKVIASCKTHEQLLAAQKMANNFLKKHRAGGFSNMAKDMGRRADVDDTLQQKNRELQGGVEEGSHYGNEKLAKARASRSGTSTVRDQDGKGGVKTTTTKTPAKKKEKTEETTVAGSVAPTETGKSKGNSLVGKGIYDSLNRDLEDMISESMNVSVNMSQDDNGEPRKSITVSAEGEAAEQLAQLLNLAGMQAQSTESGCGCESSPCSCGTGAELDENQPDWPTDQETIGNDDPLMRRYAGGLNGPKSTGQTTSAPYNRQDARQGAMSESAVSDIGMKLYAELKGFKG